MYYDYVLFILCVVGAIYGVITNINIYREGYLDD